MGNHLVAAEYGEPIDTIKQNPLTEIEDLYRDLQPYSEYFRCGPNNRKSESTLNQGNLAYLYLAVPHHFTELKQLLRWCLHIAVMDIENVEVNLAVTDQDYSSNHGHIQLGKALVKFCNELPPEQVKPLTAKIVASSQQSTELASNIIYCAGLLEKQYPGGTAAWLEQTSGLADKARDHWLTICCEETIDDTEAVSAFLEAGKEMIAQAGDNIGHWWFFGFDRKADVQTIQKKAARAKQILQFITTTDLPLQNANTFFGYLLDLEQFEVNDLLAALKAIGEYCKATGNPLSEETFGIYFEDLYTGTHEITDADAVASVHLELWEAANDQGGRYHPTRFHQRLRNLGACSGVALALAIDCYGIGAQDHVTSITTPPAPHHKDLAEILVAWLEMSSRVTEQNPNDCDVLEQEIRTLKEQLQVFAQYPDLKIAALDQEMDDTLDKIKAVRTQIQIHQQVPGDSPLVQKLLISAMVTHTDPKEEKPIVIPAIQAELEAWQLERTSLPGLMPIGGKIHVSTGIAPETFERVREKLDLTSTPFRMIHAGRSLILPAGQATDLTRLIRALVAHKLFQNNEPDLQLGIAGRWPEGVAAIVGASVILGSDQGIIYKPSAFSTTHDDLTGARIMAYDDGTRWTGGAFDLPQATGRTDMLGRHAGIDILHYQVLGTLASHYVYNGRWGHLFESYRERFQTTLQKAGLHKTIQESAWIYQKGSTDKKDDDKHGRMVNKLAHVWIQAQAEANEGISGEVRAHIQAMMRNIHAEREITKAMFPHDWANLQRVQFVSQ